MIGKSSEYSYKMTQPGELHCERIRYLVELGFDVNQTDAFGQSPLHTVARDNVQVDTVLTLLELGAKVTTVSKTGETPLHISTMNPDICRILSEHCVKSQLGVNFRDKFGSTPLHWSLWFKERESLKILMSNSADITLKDSAGMTPVDLVEYLDLDDSFKAILTSGEEKSNKDCSIIGNIDGNYSAVADCESEGEEFLMELSGEETLNTDHSITQKIHDKSALVDENDSGEGEQLKSDRTTEQSRKETSNKDSSITGYIDDNSALVCEGESVGEEDTLESEGTEQSGKETLNNDHSVAQHIDDNSGFVDESEFGEEEELESNGTIVDTEAWYEKTGNKTVSLKKLASMILLSERMCLYFCFEENQAIHNVISQIINKLAAYVAVADPVLCSTISLAGSVNEGTKVGWQNEFDYIWSLNHFNENFVPFESQSHPEGYVKLKLPEGLQNMSELEKFLDSDRCLDAQELNYRMYLLINQGLLEIFLGKQGYGIDLSCITIAKLLDIKTGKLSHIGFVWIGPTMKNIIINVDIVPTIVPKEWNPQRFKIPQLSIFKTLQELPYLAVVTKCPNSRLVPKSSSFLRIAYAHLERAIIRNAPETVRKGHILVKALVNSHYFPSVRNGYTDDKVEISTYKVKTCFLHELNDHVDKKISGDKSQTTTTEEIAVHWAIKIVNRLGLSVENRNLPSFFDRNKNILCAEGDSVLEDDRVLGYGTLVDSLKGLLILSTEGSQQGEHGESAFKNFLKQRKEKI